MKPGSFNSYISSPAGLPKLAVIPGAHVAVALPAINGTVAPGFKGYLGQGTALAADGFIHLPRSGIKIVTALTATRTLLPGRPAGRTTGWLVGEAFFGKKLLLAGSKNKLRATFLARQSFVLIDHHTLPKGYSP